MPQPIEVMLARWPLLYPETTDADEAARVREEVIAPILVTPDLFDTFEEKREEYGKWARLPGRGPGNPDGPGGPEG